MITPDCPHCGGPMRVKVARRGPKPGSEFWGCNAYRIKRCLGTRDVPQQEWDWFGLVPVPVSIVRNAQRDYNEAMEDFLAYEHDSVGIFCGYDDYDDRLANFERAMEAENRYGDQTARAEIDRSLNGGETGYKLARGILEVANQFGSSNLVRDAISNAITENFAGSASSRLGNYLDPYDDVAIGLVFLDDGSRIVFNRTTHGVQMCVTDSGFQSTVLSDNDFQYIAEYFMKNFGSHTPSAMNYL